MGVFIKIEARKLIWTKLIATKDYQTNILWLKKKNDNTWIL